MMKVYRSLSASGLDRNGIVHDISEFLSSHNCNLEDIRFNVIGGQFSFIALFSGTEKDISSLEKDLPPFREKTLLNLNIADPKEAGNGASSMKNARVEVVAMDSPGILAQVSDVLQRFKVNIDALDSHLSPNPLGRLTVTSIKIKASIPSDVSTDTIKRALMELASRINLDVLFQPMPE
jgi:glycine cleavage system regulatory protein